MTKTQKNEAKNFALAAAKIARERNCSDVTILDLTGKSPATNYFLIATSTSDRQGRTVADEICIQAKKAGFQRAIELARQWQLYRQDYCGCVYSTRSKYELTQ